MGMNECDLSEGINVYFGRISGRVFGGRFRNYVSGTRRLVGVKMAQEVNHPHECSVPTKDFSIPSEGDMKKGILFALRAFSAGSDVYAGCMGGIGRTGLFMGCMAKVMQDFYNGEFSDPVDYVRENYRSRAIETPAQEEFVRSFDTTEALAWLRDTLGPEIVVKEVVRVYVPTWKQFLAHKLLGTPINP